MSDLLSTEEIAQLNHHGISTQDGLDGQEILNQGDITPLQLKALLDKNPDLYLLDVREPHELAICRIENSRNIPLGSLPLRYAEAPRDKPVVLFCKMGGRSAQAIRFLQGKGYSNLTNLTGGITRWIDEVDPSLTKY